MPFLTDQCLKHRLMDSVYNDIHQAWLLLASYFDGLMHSKMPLLKDFSITPSILSVHIALFFNTPVHNKDVTVVLALNPHL